jgi:hypothetical protein
VVGVISPWNFPVNLTFTPLAGIFAAGNRVMIKPSEFTPRTSELMERMFRSAYDETEVAVFTGGPEVGGAFSKLAFDHLLFTGATSIAYHVMRAAAENLVPTTLELGGKSPVIIGKSADMKLTAKRVMMGKTLNAGQICLAPDYVMVPKDRRRNSSARPRARCATMFPTLKDNPDYTSVINQRHYDRLTGYLDDAKAKGAEIVELNPAKEDFRQQPFHKIPPTLVLNPTDDMKIMKDEIFGPLLPVKTYDTVDEAIGYVNDHARPLGLYYFGAIRGAGPRADAHDFGRRHRQRCGDACEHGGFAVRRRRPVGHGRLSRHRRLPHLQPRQGRVPAGEDGRDRDDAPALWRENPEDDGRPDQAVVASQIDAFERRRSKERLESLGLVAGEAFPKKGSRLPFAFRIGERLRHAPNERRIALRNVHFYTGHALSLQATAIIVDGLAPGGDHMRLLSFRKYIRKSV